MRPTSRSEASAVLFGPSRYQNGGYPTGPGIVDAMLKEAEPAIAGTPDPAKIKNLLRLDRRLLELYASWLSLEAELRRHDETANVCTRMARG